MIGKRIYIVFLFIAAGLICQTCSYNNLEDIQLNAVCDEELPKVVSFKNDIQPILQENCSTSGCHSGSDPAGDFNLEASMAYAQLLEAGSGYVDTINPKYSVVYSSLLSTSNPMPPSGHLDKCSIDLIEKWMLQKAKNN
jgi:hypothetical protein